MVMSSGKNYYVGDVRGMGAIKEECDGRRII